MSKLKFTEEYCNQEIYDVKENDPRYQKALESFRETIKAGDIAKVEDSAIYLESMVSDITYEKGFNDGIRTVLKALAGQDIAGVDYNIGGAGK